MDQETSCATNPFLEPWPGPFGAPPFDRLKPSHFGHAFEIALADAQAETGAIAADPKPPSFENTIEALERSIAERPQARLADEIQFDEVHDGGSRIKPAQRN